ncbi:MAG: glycosyltransferase family 2 protein [Flavisolibacter sp.]
MVADNNSTDNSLVFLQQYYGHVQLIKLSKNFGFAEGYNKALSQVEADYYVLLNSDVEVSQDWLLPIIELLEENEHNAACQPKLLSYDKRTYFEYAGAAGGWLDLYGYPFARGRIFNFCEQDTHQYDTTEEIFWASGAALVIKSSVFHEIGGFDPYLFAHQEEIDLCWRIQLRGYKIFCCGKSVVYHVGGGTLPRTNSKKTFLNFRNNHILLAKNLPWVEKCWKIPFRIVLDLLSALKGLINGETGYFWAILKAHWAFYFWILGGKKNRYQDPRKRLKSLSGVYKGNIAWQHFACGKQLFSQIEPIIRS